eukprot:209208-Amphidinium_carterae.1
MQERTFLSPLRLGDPSRCAGTSICGRKVEPNGCVFESACFAKCLARESAYACASSHKATFREQWRGLASNNVDGCGSLSTTAHPCLWAAPAVLRRAC